MPVTIRDVARSVNLSHTTVSRVLNDRDAISIPASTRERVRLAAREMGYSPNRSARALATGRTQLIALQLFRLSSPYAWMVSQQMQALVSADGYEVVVREFGHGDLNLQSSVDGILAMGSAHLPQDTAAQLSVPYVLMGPAVASSLAQDQVKVDFEIGARQATQHLIRLGRKRIAHITSLDPQLPGDARSDGYRAAMEEAGLKPEFMMVPDDLRASGRRAIERYAAQGDLPDALFCRNDELASGCLRALYTLGRTVPGDVAVIGCDGIEEGEYLQPALSTVAFPVAEMCCLAWQFLRRRMEDRETPRQAIILSSSLLLRESA